jgi:hypothetical protein
MLRTEPIVVLLNGLGAVVSTVLAALVLTDVIGWDAAQIGGVVAAVTAVCGLLSLVLRAAVVSPATDEARTEAAIDDVMGVELVD